MNSDLPCAIVRDLLPSYVEGLTEAETTAAVQGHLKACEDCRKRYEAMAEPAAAPDTEKEVDYLKHVRSSNTRRIVLAVALAVALVLAGVCAKLFWIGSLCDGSSAAIDASVSEDHTSLTLHLSEMNSAAAFQGLAVETRDGVTRVAAREVLVSPLRSDGQLTTTLPLEGVQRVEVFGLTVWQDGLLIHPRTNHLLDLRVPYVGSAPDVKRLIDNLDLDAASTLELQTAREPYGVTIHFTKALEENRHFMAEGSAYLLLALVDNLGEVSWDDPSGYADSLTLEEANRALPALVQSYNEVNATDFLPLDSVKDYGADHYHLQLLRDLLGV